MRYALIYSLLALVIVNEPCQSFRILTLLPTPIKSHFHFIEVILKELANKGNEIHVVSHFPQEQPIPGYTDISIKDSVPLFNNISIDETANKLILDFLNELYTNFGRELCENIINHPEIKKLRNSLIKYDVILVEVYGTDCLLPFADVFGSPIIGVSTTGYLPWALERMGNPDNPSYITNYFLPFNGKLDLLEKIQVTIATIVTKLGYHVFSTIPSEMRVRDAFGDDVRPLDEIAFNTSLLLVNAHFSMNEPKPIVPGLIEVGGLHIKTPKSLPKKLANYAETNDGIIYVSFGTVLNITTMAEDKLKALINSLGKLKQTIFVTSEIRFTSNKLPSNFVLEKWFPQLDVLCNSNTKLFITHGGPMSVQEAAYCGLPILGIPIFAEHDLVIENYVSKGGGLKIYYNNLNEATLDDALNELLTNNTYRDAGNDMSIIFKDRPTKPLDTSIYWINYVYRYKGAHQLRSRAADMIWFEYFLIDVGIVAGILAIILFLAMIYILDFLQNYFDAPVEQTKDNNKKEQ